MFFTYSVATGFGHNPRQHDGTEDPLGPWPAALSWQKPVAIAQSRTPNLYFRARRFLPVIARAVGAVYRSSRPAVVVGHARERVWPVGLLSLPSGDLPGLRSHREPRTHLGGSEGTGDGVNP